MPQKRKILSLAEQSTVICAKNLGKSLKKLESLWTPKPKRPLSSPRVSPISPAARGIIPPDPVPTPEEIAYEAKEEARLKQVQGVREWLSNCPFIIIEKVIDLTLQQIEQDIVEDKDRKLILTLINIERLKPSDLCFGFHALLDVISDVELPLTKFSPSFKLTYCLWEYNQIMSSASLTDKLCETVPRLSSLHTLCLAHLATDKICYFVSIHLPGLQDLDLSHSNITDRALKLISGIRPTQLQLKEYLPCSNSQSAQQNGNLKLRKLTLDGCALISDMTVWHLITRLPNLMVINYHQAFSIAEILCKECSVLDEAELNSLRLKLTNFNHPFPYALNLFGELLLKVTTVCPNITVLNIVASDGSLVHYDVMEHLKSVTIEVDDCFGLGLLHFLTKFGSQLEDVALSCSSDSDSSFLPEGGQSYQLFNIGLKLARWLCSSKLKSLSIAGCGLVSNLLIHKINRTGFGWIEPMQPGPGQEEPEPVLRNLRELESLLFLSYEDDQPMQTCEANLLLETLQGCPNLRVLSLEGNFTPFFNDTFIQRLLAKNHMCHLEVLDIQGPVPLTEASARIILDLDCLKEVRLSTWNISESQIAVLKKRIFDNGYDLHFRN